MATWSEVSEAAPELTEAVRQCFAVRKHATLATLRKDGAPRISGTEVEFDGTDVLVGSMPGAMKALDLRRDPRFALHSPTVDSPEGAPESWPGEAKLAGVAEELSDPASTTEVHRFRLDIGEIVLTRVVDGRLEITSWHEGRGVQVQSRL